MSKSYQRFAAMIATSTVVMFGLMYLNTYTLDHVYWSETRSWMALLMGATMAVIMLGYMLGMYENRKLNIGIFAGSIIVFALTLWLVRSQATVSGVDYMRAMIPHHSIAVLTSERAQIVDPRVRKLADEIIAAQRREIAEMKYLIHAVDRDGPQARAATGPEVAPEIVPAADALRRAELARVDLAEMDAADVGKVLGEGPACGFAYSLHAGPVAVARVPAAGTGPTIGVAKVHGALIELRAFHDTSAAKAGTDVAALTLVADGIEVAIDSVDAAALSTVLESEIVDERAIEAEAVLRLAADLEVGYRGFVRCTGGPP